MGQAVLPCCHVTGNWATPAPPPPQLFAILAKTPYCHEKKGLCGIDQLLAESVFSAAFPLHDVRPEGWLLGCEGEFLAKQDPRACPPC